MSKKLRVAFAVISVVSLLHVLYFAAVSVVQPIDDDELFRPPELARETAARTTVEGFSTSQKALELPPQSLNGSSTAPQDDPNRTTKQNQPSKLLDDEAINTSNTTNADLTPKAILGSSNSTIGDTVTSRERPSNTTQKEKVQKPDGTKTNTIPVIQQDDVSSRQAVSTGTPKATQRQKERRHRNDHRNNTAASKPTTTTTTTTIITRKNTSLLQKEQHLKFGDGNHRKTSSFIEPNTTADAPQQVITAVVAVYQQPYCLQQIVQYLRTCPIIKEIRVNWFQNTTLPKLDEVEEYFVPPTYYYNNSNDITNSSYLAPIHFDNVEDKISHRFKPRDWKTDAIFHVDADTFYSCAAIELAYQTWISNGPNKTAVGFHSRHLKKGRHYSFAASHQSPFRYSTVFITKGGITHRDALDDFFSSKYQKLRDMVDEHITGEDMLMSFVLAISGIQTIGVCLEPDQTCAIDCAQGRQKGLVQRTAKHRPVLLKKYFQELGDPFVSKQGAEEMVWQTEERKSWKHLCYSNPFGRKSAGVAPYCVYFCKKSGTGVCPKNPKRRSNATVWTPISIFHEKGVITE